MTRGPAIIATAVALGLINIGLASLIVAALGQGVFVPLWVGVCLLGLGGTLGVVAVSLWRGYARTLSVDR